MTNPAVRSEGAQYKIKLGKVWVFKKYILAMSEENFADLIFFFLDRSSLGCNVYNLQMMSLKYEFVMLVHTRIAEE